MARSTRVKGDTFEERVYSRLKLAFRKRQFGLDPTLAVFRRKPVYFSRDRGSDIVFDLSIEIKPEKSEKPFMTIIVECKDLGKPVPVDDIEEFKAKLDQCFGKNVKGFFVSSNALQKSALNYAIAQGIGVGRITEGKLNTISYCIGGECLESFVDRERERFSKEIPHALIDEDFTGTSTSFMTYDVFILVEDKATTSLVQALSVLRDAIGLDAGVAAKF